MELNKKLLNRLGLNVVGLNVISLNISGGGTGGGMSKVPPNGALIDEDDFFLKDRNGYFLVSTESV